ncbi:MAG: hypothetical protein HYZ17_08120 [Betaproteobacteria bacterium]|nr:hypothetical protein [Betaproteobacteria bacterium]
MQTLNIKLQLPDGLAQEAGRMGLLEPANLQTLLREAVRTQRIARLTEARKRIAAAGVTPLTMDEINAEIAAERTEQRSKSAR